MNKKVSRARWVNRASKALLVLLLSASLILVFTSSLVGVGTETVESYRSLKLELAKQRSEYLRHQWAALPARQ